MKRLTQNIVDQLLAHPVVSAMILGYGEKFPPLDEIFPVELTDEDREVMNMPIPALGRYHKSTLPVRAITSQLSVSLSRFQVMLDYYVELAEFLFRKKTEQPKILDALGLPAQKVLNAIGKEPWEVKAAEMIEKFTEHDTAAAGDFLKLRIASLGPPWSDQIEGVHFACTSEDVMGNVFGLMGNRLVYGLFVPLVCDFCTNLINYSDFCEKDKPLVMPAFTHKQAAEPTTFGKKILTIVDSILRSLDFLRNQSQQGLMLFPGKMSGATGNLVTHFAAYPDLDWSSFAKSFVKRLGLSYEQFTNQSSTYVIEANILSCVANTLLPVIKFTQDFIDLASSPAHFFVKEKKAGRKGSSLMPNKSNAWAMEGAIEMLFKARSDLLLTAGRLPLYPHEGNMGRSFLFRDLGTPFMNILVGFSRISRELKDYVPNQGNINAVLSKYPGMSGGAIQTVLKREGIRGDAYRLIQEIAINPDGTYANDTEFRGGLENKMDQLELSTSLREELRGLCKPEKLIAHMVGPINVCKKEVMEYLKDFKRDAEQVCSQSIHDI